MTLQNLITEIFAYLLSKMIFEMKKVSFIVFISVLTLVLNTKCLSEYFSPGNINSIGNFEIGKNDEYDAETVLAINQLQEDGYFLSESEIDSLDAKITQPHIKLYNLIPRHYPEDEYVVYCVRVYFGVKLIAIKINGKWYHGDDVTNEAQRELFKKMTKKDVINPILGKLDKEFKK
jgi:hypothetical protein